MGSFRVEGRGNKEGKALSGFGMKTVREATYVGSGDTSDGDTSDGDT